jgi:cyclohexadienyl dehydratase
VEGRADVWVTDGVGVDHLARRHAGVLCAASLAPLTQVEKAWLIRRDPALVERINRALGEELRSGRWQRDLEAVP